MELLVQCLIQGTLSSRIALLLFLFTVPNLALRAQVDPIVSGYMNDLDGELTLDPDQFIADPVLNAFFNRQVSRYLSSSSDLNVSRAFAVLDNGNDRLTLGGQFTNNSSISSNTKLVFTGGFGADLKQGFATLFKSGTEQPNLGLLFKGTYIWNGSMSLGKKGATITTQREQRIDDLTKWQRRAAEKKATADVAELRAQQSAAQVKLTSDEMDKEKEEQYEKLLGDLSRAVATAVEEQRIYRSTHTVWLSVEAYRPLSPTNYYTIDSTTAARWNMHELRATESKLSLSYLYTNRYVGTLYGTLWAAYMNNNNVLSKQLSTASTTYNGSNARNDTLTLVQLDEQETVGIGRYSTFDTYKLGVRLVWMPLPWVGLSGEVEQWLGDYEPINWKLGVPFAFKNEKRERSINFEVQWREMLNVHSVGVSVGLPFGGTLYK